MQMGPFLRVERVMPFTTLPLNDSLIVPHVGRRRLDAVAGLELWAVELEHVHFDAVGQSSFRIGPRCGFRLSRAGRLRRDHRSGAICSGAVTPGGSSITFALRKWISPPSDSMQK